MHVLHSDIKPFRTRQLAVGDGHELYVEECGEAAGLPVLILHSGPGSQVHAKYRRFLDPEKFHMVLFDQRGCGRSIPHATTEHNHTEALIEDIEKIRHALGIQQWMILGFGWGATLGLHYAQQHPQTIKALILQGILLGNQHDIDWLSANGIGRFFPEAWQEFCEPLSAKQQLNPIKAYSTLLTDDNQIQRRMAIKAWTRFFAEVSGLHSHAKLVEDYQEPHHALSFAKIGCHYWANQFFIENNELIDHCDVLKDIPGILIHGRYDMLSPLSAARSLHQAWQGSELMVVRDAAHLTWEKVMLDAILHCVMQIETRLEL